MARLVALAALTKEPTMKTSPKLVLLALALTLSTASGCVLDLHDLPHHGGQPNGDLEVLWILTGPDLCARQGLTAVQVVLEAHGSELHRVDGRCDDFMLEQGIGFYNLPSGVYDVHLELRDDLGVERARTESITIVVSHNSAQSVRFSLEDYVPDLF